MSLYITGASGFVGSNLISYYSDKVPITKYVKGHSICIKEDVVIHLAGKAHDLKNLSDFNDYYFTNTNFTIEVFDKFIDSNAKVFIFLSSVKAAADSIETELTENLIPMPLTHYGKSKLLAEKYILQKVIPEGKRVYILRPCMIHGPGNKGNLNLLYNFVLKGFPWPLGSFNNKQSFCSIDNLIFLINELINNINVPSGIYNISDDEPLTINDVIEYIGKSLNKRIIILKIPTIFIIFIIKVFKLIKLNMIVERFEKISKNYIVSNHKIKTKINKSRFIYLCFNFMITYNIIF